MIELSDDELTLILEALDAKRAALLDQRFALNLRPKLLHERDPKADADALDGQIFHVTALFNRLQSQYMRREQSEPSEPVTSTVAAADTDTNIDDEGPCGR